MSGSWGEGRDLVKTLRLSAADWERVRRRMELVGARSFSAYARSVLVDGELRVTAVTVDPSALRVELSRIGNNLNQIARAANTESRLVLGEAMAARRLMQEVQALISAAVQGQS